MNPMRNGVWSACVFAAQFPGRVISKKNSKQIVKAGFTPRLISSKSYQEWESEIVNSLTIQANRWRQIKRGILPLQGPLRLDITFCLKNKRSEPDLSNLIEGPQDALQLSRIITNDKQIIKINAEKQFCGEDFWFFELFRWLE